MSNHTEKRSKKDENKKLIVRVVCFTLAGLLALSAFTSLLTFFTPHVHLY